MESSVFVNFFYRSDSMPHRGVFCGNIRQVGLVATTMAIMGTGRCVWSGRDSLGRLQLGYGPYQHREFLYQLPRDAEQRVQRIQENGSRLERFWSQGNLSGLPCAKKLVAYDGEKGLLYQRVVRRDTGVDQYAREIPRQALVSSRNSLDEYAENRLQGMPKLPQQTVHGPEQTSKGCPRAPSRRAAERQNLYRLSQGYRSRVAGGVY